MDTFESIRARSDAKMRALPSSERKRVKEAGALKQKLGRVVRDATPRQLLEIQYLMQRGAFRAVPDEREYTPQVDDDAIGEFQKQMAQRKAHLNRIRPPM